MTLRFTAEHDQSREILLAWWKGLENRKGDRAALRRCHEHTEAFFVPSTWELIARLRSLGGCDYAVAAVAVLAAGVKDPFDEVSVARRLGRPRGQGGSPVVSELRFRRLLQCSTVDELLPPMRRVVALLRGRIDLCGLAYAVCTWTEQTRRRWAYEYYVMGQPEAEALEKAETT